jgi:hypothetical protein
VHWYLFKNGKTKFAFFRDEDKIESFTRSLWFLGTVVVSPTPKEKCTEDHRVENLVKELLSFHGFRFHRSLADEELLSGRGDLLHGSFNT